MSGTDPHRTTLMLAEAGEARAAVGHFLAAGTTPIAGVAEPLRMVQSVCSLANDVAPARALGPDRAPHLAKATRSQ